MAASLRVSQLLDHLTPLHRQALGWFFRRTGEIHPRPGKIQLAAGETFLASAPKGIYKPRWTHYALSVRQSINGPYADQIVRRADGTWSFAYFQEGFDLAEVASKATNRGLFACLTDQVPVGVFRQVSRNPHRYEILGLALVATYDGGFFFLQGAAQSGLVHEPGPAAEFSVLMKGADPFGEVKHQSESLMEPPLLARKRVMAEILRRRGQQAFREQLLHAYENTCAISSYDAPDALEAAHIVPYADRGLSTARNGLLLRSDVHTLFDLGLVAVEPGAMTVVMSERLQGTKYESLHGRTVAQPSDPALRPDPTALAHHARWARLA